MLKAVRWSSRWKEPGIKAKYIAGDGVCSAEWAKLAAGAASPRGLAQPSRRYSLALDRIFFLDPMER
jgi:hypothetical protein